MSQVTHQELFTTGLDEAGRGALAGPVVAAAVCWPHNLSLQGLADSKKLSPQSRERLFLQITKQALAWSYVALPASQVDRMNILQASLEAMRLCLLALPESLRYPAVADGPYRPAPEIAALVKGDQLLPAISAASIVAKVVRDRILVAYDRLYSGYGFMQHKGYPTASHTQALKNQGVSPIHRRSYAPVAQYL